MVTDTMGATKLDECPFDSSVMNSVQKQKYYPILEILESDFECSGFCTEASFYLFSDVRNGVPKNGNCKEEIIHAVNANSTLYAIGLCIIGIIGFIGLVMSFCICHFHRKSYQGKQFYSSVKWGGAAKSD